MTHAICHNAITYLCLFLYQPILRHPSLSVSSENMFSEVKKKNGGMKLVKTWGLHFTHINIYSLTHKIEELHGIACLSKATVTQTEKAGSYPVRECLNGPG